MKSKSYKNYRICPVCGIELPLTREFFSRYGDNTGYHKVCRECEEKLQIEHEWKNGLLLCHDCLQYKEESEFSANGSSSAIRNNRRHICRDCATKRQREHDLSLDSKTKLKKCLRFRLLGARDRATKAGIPFNLTLEFLEELWIKQDGKCALSGLPMTFELKLGRTPTNVSIDKKNRLLGYTQDNVQLVCMAANQAKSDMSEEELYNLCKSIVNTYENKNNFCS